MEYLEKQKSPQKEIIKKLRKIISKTIPNSNEEKAGGVLAYGKGKFYLAGLKNSVNMGFSIVGLSKEEASLFKGQGKTMRHLKFSKLKDIGEKEIVKLLKLVNKKAKCIEC